LPQGSTGQPFSLEACDTIEAPVSKPADEIETYTMQLAKKLIQNVLTDQAPAAEDQKGIQERIEEAVTSSVTVEPSEKITLLLHKKNKKKKNKKGIYEISSITHLSAQQNKEQPINSNELESDIEQKANGSQAGESNRTFDLSIFDELNKKVSKNKKKKLKKKLKRDKLKKGQSLEESNQTDFISYLIDTKILRELDFHDKYENATETTCDHMWETTTDGTSVRTLVGAGLDSASHHKEKIGSLMSRSGTPNEDSDSEEKSLSQYSQVNAERVSEFKERGREEKKEVQVAETSKHTESRNSKVEERKQQQATEKQKERFKLVPKSYKNNNGSNSSSLNTSTHIYRPQQNYQLNQSRVYEKLSNTQLSDYDLSGFTEVKGKKKKPQERLSHQSSNLVTKADQQKHYYGRYQYEEKKPKAPQTISRNTQQAVIKAVEIKEKIVSVKSESTLSQEKQQTTENTSSTVVETKVQNSCESSKDIQTQKVEQDKAAQNTTVSNVQESKSESTAPKKKPLRLTSSALPLKFNAIETETQKKAAISKVVNSIYEERVEKDLASYVKKLNNESNVFEDCRRVTFNRLKHIIVNSLQGEGRSISIKPYGSCVTGLALNFSDIDIAVSGVYARDREHLLSLLQAMFEKLKAFAWVKEPKVISTATLPVLKLEVNPSIDISLGDYSKDSALKDLIDGLTDKQWNEMNLKEHQKNDTMQIRIDISIEDGHFGHIGVVSTDFVSKMIEYHESLYSITLVLKQHLAEKELLNKFQGGISSYCLLVMLVAYLRTYEQTGIAKNFLECLRYYGKEFDPKTTGINLCFEPKPIYQFLPLPEQSPFYLYDRLRFDRNLGHTTSKIDLILKEFSNLDDYFNNYKQAIEKVVTANSWLSMQAVDYKALSSHPELQAYKNKNLLDEIFQLTKLK